VGVTGHQYRGIAASLAEELEKFARDGNVGLLLLMRPTRQTHAPSRKREPSPPWFSAFLPNPFVSELCGACREASVAFSQSLPSPANDKTITADFRPAARSRP
jgi:hypothetical protein